MENKKWTVLVAVILSAGLIISASVVGGVLLKTRTQASVITVVGSAKQQIRSDFGVWIGTYTYQAVSLVDAYRGIQDSRKTVEDYLETKGVSKNEMDFSAIDIQTIYRQSDNGWSTNEVESYRLVTSVTVQMNDVDKIAEISSSSTDLIDQGIVFSSNMPQYYYTKLADLKVEMLAKAAEDARKRAEVIASMAGTKITGVKSGKMGVFQITKLYSEDVSDYGINDTTSIEKEIMAVVNGEFKAK